MKQFRRFRHFKIVLLSAPLALSLVSVDASADIVVTENPTNHSLNSIRIDNDLMNWMLAADGTQYPWVTAKYGWGLGYLSQDGQHHDWLFERKDGAALIYKAGNVEVRVKRYVDDNGDLRETYKLTNTGKHAVSLSNIGIYTPFNDNYPDAQTCMTSRCNTHIYAGGDCAWVDAVRMSGKGHHLGLVVTRGAIADYEVWERGSDKGWSNFRGVFALNMPDMTLKPRQSYTLRWTLFEHSEVDFNEQILRRGGIIAASDKYVYAVGETAKVRFMLPNGKIKIVSRPIDKQGESKVTYTYKGHTATATLLGISSEHQLVDKRVDFILQHQQMKDLSDARYGAFMVYDNEGDSILTNDYGRADLDEGRERVGMGILLAAYSRNVKDAAQRARNTDALVKYASFIRNKLQTADYTTTSSVTRDVPNRGYNYAWISDFYFRMYELTGNRQYALDGYGTLKALYRMFGHEFYCIDYPVTVGLRALKQAGLDAERDSLLHDFTTTADLYVKNGLNFPKFEVNYEQSIVAPAVQFLCEIYLATNNTNYLDGAKTLMPALEAFLGNQPHYRLNGIGVRHWDGFWFGKRQTYGDVFPHYWSSITAGAFHYYALATGRNVYQRRAENIVRNNLCQFYEDGRASCAFLNPRRINGTPAHYADAYANDQDWALVFYMLVHS